MFILETSQYVSPAHPLLSIFLLSSIILGLRFIRNNNNQKSKTCWGISLMIGGLGALLAGTSYQAFGYELKCAGKEYCSWTNWWELWYEILTIASAGTLLVAVSRHALLKHGKNIPLPLL